MRCLEHLIEQIIKKPEKLVVSDSCRVLIKCKNCDKINNVGTRNLKRKWGDGPYLCKSCHIKTYIDNPERLKKFQKSLGEALQKPEVRKKLSNNGKLAWSNPETSKRIKEAISEGHRSNPKMIAARDRAHKAWMQKYGIDKMLAMADLGHEAIKQKCVQSQDFRNLLGKNFHIDDPMVMEKVRKSPAFLTKEKWQDPDFRKRMANIITNQPRVSGIQRKLYEILDDLGVNYQKDTQIGFYSVDCVIPKQKEMAKSIIIEVQGDYWHNIPATIQKDKTKSEYLMKYYSEYDLKYLWEHEFRNESRIRELLKYWINGESELIAFDVNNVVERVVNRHLAEEFVGKYHYAGRLGTSQLMLGYYLKEELISVIVYGYPVRQETATRLGVEPHQVLELNRLAISPKYQIKNLASYVIGKSIRHLKHNRKDIIILVSFSDTTHNHIGTIYKASNWKFDGTIDADYWYKDQDGFVYHKKTVWNKAKANNLTEVQYSEKTNLIKIWGKPKHRFVYVLDKLKVKITNVLGDTRCLP